MKVLFIDTVHSILADKLKENNFTCIDGTTLNKEELFAMGHDIHGIVIRSRFTMNEDFLHHFTKLKFIARSGAGMENIDVNYCEKRNITLFNSPEGNRNAVAEHALGMLLSLFNHLNKANSEVRQGIWDRDGNRGIELEGKTVGIIGYGNNGSAFAKKLRGFDVEILAYDKYKKTFANEFVKESSLDDIFEKVDILSFHIPQNEETIYYANESFFKAFKKPIYLINLSRGKIVETNALIKALESKKVLGACLDVLEHEPSSFESLFSKGIPEEMKRLFTFENVLLSPHVGGWTEESYVKLSAVLAEKIITTF